MFSDSGDFTHQPPARRTLSTVVADLAQLKAHIDQTDREMSNCWRHFLTVCQYNAQIAADRHQFRLVRDALRVQVARMWEQALWVSEHLEPSPQEPPSAQVGYAQMPSEGRHLRPVRHQGPASTRLPSSEAAPTSSSFGWLPGQERPELN